MDLDVADADFASGFDAAPPVVVVKVEPVVETVAEPAAPKYVQITEEQFAEMTGAAKKTATLEQQLSKAFGTLGDLQKFVKEQKALTPRGIKAEVSKEAFAEMAKDFPELAEHARTGLEAAFKGIEVGTAEAPDVEKMVAEHAAKIEIDSLEDAFPDWRQIVGAVDISQQEPDAENPFRKWLGTKDAAYQARINGANSAAIIERAIKAFQTQTATDATAPAAANPTAQLRAARIKDAVKPKGDGGQPTARNTENDDFVAGFNSR